MPIRARVLRSVLTGVVSLSVASMVAPAMVHAATPTPQTLSGPELSAREKVIHVLNRLAYGPHPGEVDRIAAEEGAEGWIKKQMEPEKIDDSALEKEVHERFKWAEQKNILDVRKYAPEEG